MENDIMRGRILKTIPIQVLAVGLLCLLTTQSALAQTPMTRLRIENELVERYFPEKLFVDYNPALAAEVIVQPVEDDYFRDTGEYIVTRLLEIQLAPNDTARYIIDFSEGWSLDPTFFISRQDGDTLQELGYIPALNLKIPGDGYLYSSGHTNNTFNQRRKFTTRDGTLDEIQQPFYYVGLETRTRIPLVIYSTPEGGAQVAELAAKTAITVVANTGNLYLIKTPDDVLGWIQLDVGQDDTQIEGLYFFGD
jgi:hypothetical protein